jgi:hypothetical protein
MLLPRVPAVAGGHRVVVRWVLAVLNFVRLGTGFTGWAE